MLNTVKLKKTFLMKIKGVLKVRAKLLLTNLQVRLINLVAMYKVSLRLLGTELEFVMWVKLEY